MKILIIEGPDNSGKDLLISKIISKFTTSTIIHCKKPDFNISNELEILYETYINSINNNKYNTDILIFNRSWLGEYVYGQLYRNKDKNEIINNIKHIENMLKKHNVYYIQLLSSSNVLLLNNEDGLSLSKSSLDKISLENSLFKEVFELSSIKNKKLVYVNKDDNFREYKDIHNEIFNFLKI